MMRLRRQRSYLFALGVIIVLTTTSCSRVPPAQKEPLTQQRLLAALLQTALGNVDKTAAGALPGPAEFFKGVIPPNVFAAANNGDVLPLAVFALLFGLALTRPAAFAVERRRG